MSKPVLTSILAGLIVVAVGAALLIHGGAGPAGAGEIRLRPDDARVTRQGAEIYAAECASCHGADLAGQPNWQTRRADGRLPAPPHDETGHTWHHSDQLLFDFTKSGPAALIGGGYESDMQPYAGILTDDEIVAVLSYIKSTWPEAVRRRHDALNAGQ